MSKKRTSLVISEDLSDVFSNNIGESTANSQSKNTLTIKQAIATITRQMETAGFRPRTISDYRLHVTHFAEITGTRYLSEITADHIYEWLSSMNVNNQTKLTRLKCLKAFLGRCLDAGWLTSNFWKSIVIRVDSPVKEGATDREVNLLLSLLDLSDFVHLRDAAAILLMYQCGLRIGTLSKLENKHIDIASQTLKIGGEIVKNHEQVHLPFDDVLKRILSVLLRQNDAIRNECKTRNDFVFITIHGGPITTSPTHNNIQKRLNKYAREYGLKNINPHALRRGFAKNLLEKGADIATISKALGHSDIAVTSRYLHMDKKEVAETLRKFL